MYWQVTSSASFGTGASFVGTVMALTSITFDPAVTMQGRALARNGNVVLNNTTITAPLCEQPSGDDDDDTTGGVTSEGTASDGVDEVPVGGVQTGVGGDAGGLSPTAVFATLAVLAFGGAVLVPVLRNRRSPRA